MWTSATSYNSVTRHMLLATPLRNIPPLPPLANWVDARGDSQTYDVVCVITKFGDNTDLFGNLPVVS